MPCPVGSSPAFSGLDLCSGTVRTPNLLSKSGKDVEGKGRKLAESTATFYEVPKEVEP
jgi:hypothetical protein